MMCTAREEDWGRLVYDESSDEFEAHVRGGVTDFHVLRPISAGCLITGRCNLSCSFCYGNYESLPGSEISADRWRRIFGHLFSLGLMRVDLSGGEPTLRRDLPDIARAATDFGLNTIVSTNGLVLSAEALAKFPPVRWHVSLDSGIPEVHENSRLLRILKPSDGSFKKASDFVVRCLRMGHRVRVLTCVGDHNRDLLFALGEHLVLLGVPEWNISRVLRAGRAQCRYADRWEVSDEYLKEQVSDLRSTFSFMRIRYSSRTDQNGYFLLVLPDGALATQYTDGSDKVILANDALRISAAALQNNPLFSLEEHGKKWISAQLDWQPFHQNVAPALWDPPSSRPFEMTV